MYPENRAKALDRAQSLQFSAEQSMHRKAGLNRMKGRQMNRHTRTDRRNLQPLHVG